MYICLYTHTHTRTHTHIHTHTHTQELVEADGAMMVSMSAQGSGFFHMLLLYVSFHIYWALL